MHRTGYTDAAGGASPAPRPTPRRPSARRSDASLANSRGTIVVLLVPVSSFGSSVSYGRASASGLPRYFLPANPGSPGMPDALSRARAYMTVRGRPRFRHAILRPPAGAVLRPARAGQGTVPAGGRAHRPAVRIGDHERARRAFAERRRGHAGSGTPHSGAETQAARTLPGDAGEPRGRGAARTRTVQIIGTSRSGRTEPP